MFTWPRMVALILVLYAGISIYRGRITISDDNDRTTNWITRKEKPFQFWLIMVVILALAVVLGLNLFNF